MCLPFALLLLIIPGLFFILALNPCFLILLRFVILYYNLVFTKKNFFLNIIIEKFQIVIKVIYNSIMKKEINIKCRFFSIFMSKVFIYFGGILAFTTGFAYILSKISSLFGLLGMIILFISRFFIVNQISRNQLSKKLMCISICGISGIFSVFITHPIFYSAFSSSLFVFISTSLFGFITKRDLTNLSTLIPVGVFSMLLANIFLSLFFPFYIKNLIISFMGVFLSSISIVRITNQLKEQYERNYDNNNLSLIGGFLLLNEFINLFIYIFSLLASRKKR